MRPITAADVMNPRVLTVRADMTVRELAHFLMENEISGAPVVDEDSKLVGVVSVTDITFALAEDGEDEEEEEDEGDRTASDFFRDAWGEGLVRAEIEDLDLEDELEVREIMTPEVHTVPEETPIPEVAELMIRSHVHRLLVTREDKVVGILSTSDLLGLLVRE
jgi:CBS domain-containing protein